MAVQFLATGQDQLVLGDAPQYELVRSVVAVGSKGSAPGDLWYPTGVAVDSNTDQIYITHGVGYSSQVSIFSEKGEFLKRFTHSHMRYPWGVAINGDHVYISDITIHSIFHFELAADINFISSVGKRGSGIGMFNEPRQLTVSSNGFVFVTDFQNNRIQILDSELRYQRHFSHKSMTCPCDIKLASEEVYVLCSEDSFGVHVFSQTGNKLRSLIACDDNLILPSLFCMDTDGNFIITDKHDHKIKVFSSEGKFLHAIGKQGHGVGMFEHPRGIALTNNLKLAIVSWNNNYRLQIFSC